MDFQRVDIPSLFSPIYGKLRKYDEDLAKTLQVLMGNLKRMFAGGISLDGNVDGQIVTLTTHASADTEFSVAHTLKRIPTGFIVVKRDKGGVIYDGVTAWDSTQIFLKCTTTSTLVTVLIF
jgi:hypothetical protein